MALQRIGERQRAGHDFENALSIWCPSSSNSSNCLPPLSITHGLPCLAVGPPLTSSSATTPTAMLTPAASPLSSSDALACLSAAAMGRGAMGIPAEQVGPIPYISHAHHRRMHTVSVLLTNFKSWDKDSRSQ